jgi:lipopolysaccharide transport system ATP-binding protein
MSVVRLTDVHKTYRVPGGDAIRAVDNVSLFIGTGDRVGIIGPNGAGKSTLLQLITGLTTPTSGSISVIGHVTAVMTLGVGMREHATGRENIYLDGELQGKSRAEIDRVLDDVIAFSELGDFIDEPVRMYSTGMKARLAFSMLCHIDPEILVIDEALSVGDASFSRKAAAKIGELCARGKVVIIVSHSMTAIREICNRCLWLDAGRVVMDGEPVAVTDRYIETVRRADQELALARFQESAVRQSLRPGWSLDLSLHQSESPDRRLLETGAALRVHLAGSGPTVGSSEIQLAIVRLDGMLMFSETFPAGDFTGTDGRMALDVWMEPLVLAAGTYRVEASLLSGTERVAEYATVCEVYSPLPPAGGKPMLNYPLTVDVVARHA